MSKSARIHEIPNTRSATTATPSATTPTSAARAPPRTIGTWYAGIRSSARHDDAARAAHDRPTVVERAIATIPLPFPVTCTILALLATGPGYFLAHLIESGGDWNQTVAAVFGGAFALPLWRSIPLIILSVGFDVYLLWLVPPSRLHIPRYAKEIAPLLAHKEAGGRLILFPPHLRPPPFGAPPPLSVFFVPFLHPRPPL